MASKLRTCRYWALGPRCPNNNPFGVNVCKFAHWDTGVLADHLKQRGTCLNFVQRGFCPKLKDCFYEHRNTGVTGLFQGSEAYYSDHLLPWLTVTALELEGFELEVANAAYRAGFDTRHSEALFDLIWSVKRIAMRAPGLPPLSSARLPPHPIYPDRYRPSDFSDHNTRKRPQAQDTGRNATLAEFKFHPVPPLTRKRKNEGSQINSITLKSDGEEVETAKTPAHSSAKRQKISQPKMKKPKKQEKPKKRKGAIQNKTAPASGPKSFPSGVVNISSRGIFLLDHFFPPSEQVKPLTSRTGARMIESSNPKPMKEITSTPAMVADDGITKQLLSVGYKLEQAKNSMNNSQAAMRTMFDHNVDRFDREAVMTILQRLASCMNLVYDGGRDGMVEVDRAVEWLNRERWEFSKR